MNRVRRFLRKFRYNVHVEKIHFFIVRQIFSFLHSGDTLTCAICKSSFKKFAKAGFDLPVLKEKKVVGAGRRDNAVCPGCGSGDRERAIEYIVMSKQLLKTGMSMLHIAPEKNLRKIFKEKVTSYVTADLNSSTVRIKMDVTDIPFEDCAFDAIVCNHVLEHVPDDRKAMAELYRVLKPNGWAILQVPYSQVLEETFEDPNIIDPSEREKFYGQNDHVRLYSKQDYIRRLESAGLSVTVIELDDKVIADNALNAEEKIFLVRKDQIAAPQLLKAA